MLTSIGKTSTFLLLLVLTAICSLAVSAQIATPERGFSTVAPAKNLKTGSNTQTAAPAEKIGDEPARLPGNFRQLLLDEKENDLEIGSAEISIDEWRLSSAETRTNEFTYRFARTEVPSKRFDFENLPIVEEKRFSFTTVPANAVSDDDKKNGAPDEDDAANDKDQNFNWRAAIGQSLLFLGVQHGYAFTQPKTREAMKGKFWKDYVDSVKSLRGWDDGGRFFTNYIAHPMQGSFTGFIYVQNDPKAKKLEFGTSKDYWTSRMKAMLWTTAWSTQFEIGPISQASIGNVGLKGKQTWEDIINTPTLGTAMLVGEDAVDRFIIKNIERRTNNFYVKIFSRMLLNPTRNFSNMFRFKPPWYRDRPVAR